MFELKCPLKTVTFFVIGTVVFCECLQHTFSHTDNNVNLFDSFLVDLHWLSSGAVRGAHLATFGTSSQSVLTGG